MTISSANVTIGTVATLIYRSGENPVRLHLHNDDNTDTIDLGNASVTTATGLSLLKNDSIELILNPNESLFGISSKEGHSMSFLAQTP